MPKSIFYKLSEKAKIWTAKAIAGVIVADGVVTNEEIEVLKDTINFIDDTVIVGSIIKQMKNRKQPEIENLVIDRTLAVEILMALMHVAAVDTEFDVQEVNYILDLGKKLGFGKGYTNQVIEWCQADMELQEKKQQLISEGMAAKPIYSS